MVSFYSLFLAIASVASVYAAPAEGVELVARADTGPVGYFSYWWTDGAANATYTNGSGGIYTIAWSNNTGQFVGGKGWNPGTSTRVINYSGLYKPDGNSYLSIYGWTRNPLIEYYIVESYGTINPSSFGTKKGSVTCDGADYDISQVTRANQPSIDGTRTFLQFWSVRNPKKTPGGSISGTITLSCHFNAWRSLGMLTGSSHAYQIVATWGYGPSGTSTISIA